MFPSFAIRSISFARRLEKITVDMPNMNRMVRTNFCHRFICSETKMAIGIMNVTKSQRIVTVAVACRVSVLPMQNHFGVLLTIQVG